MKNDEVKIKLKQTFAFLCLSFGVLYYLGFYHLKQKDNKVSKNTSACSA